ncbi:MAG: flagellar hook basal-body protein [Candidatus Gastranaerophilales bacterium]|nr:flagellar hook basal-body protein [Candidatus Gastranaerophilales bacterium]
MSSFQGVIRRNIINANTQFEKLGYISSNISNYNTTAYRAVRFDEMLGENGYLDGVVRRSFTVGAPLRTDQPFDVSLSGAGFIPVTSRTGDVTYTRDGAFKLDKDGYLITNDDCLVGDGIKIPANYDAIIIKPNGDVTAVLEAGGKEKKLGTIPVVNFLNPEGLKGGDGNKFICTDDSGEPILMTNHHSVMQGYLERPNVDMYDQVNTVMRLNASMLASFKVMKAVDDMYNKAVTLNQ